jgi:hypothetical protein
MQRPNEALTETAGCNRSTGARFGTAPATDFLIEPVLVECRRHLVYAAQDEESHCRDVRASLATGRKVLDR